MSAAEPSRHDLEAAVAARRELGPQYEDAVLDSFLDRMDRSIADRVDARLTQRLDQPAAAGRPAGGGPDGALVLGIVSLGTGIPITAIAAGVTHLPGLMVVWAGIAAVNAAHAWGRRRS